MSDLGPMSRACETSLAAAALSERDQAAAALARRYSALMDRAEVISETAMLELIDLDPDDRDGYRRLAIVERAISSQSVASDLGPKLLATLTSLGCTLAGRGVKGKETTGAASPARQAHDEFTERRRQRDAAADDAASS
jgi:hypothetical protein